MPTRNVTDFYRNDNSATLRNVAEHDVGQRIRVSRRDGWNAGVWATIAMVIASRNRLCWLVEYGNGSTDVVPIFGNPDHFDLAQ